MPPNTRPCIHHLGLVEVKVGFPWASDPVLRAVIASTRLVQGGRNHLGLFGVVKLQGRLPCPVRSSWQSHLYGETLSGQIDAPVVLCVTKPLNVEQSHLWTFHREGSPVPGAAVQYQGLQSLDPEGTNGSRLFVVA